MTKPELPEATNQSALIFTIWTGLPQADDNRTEL